jgi:tyrosinase
MNETARDPVSTSYTLIVSQNDLVAQTLDSQASSIRDKLYNIFAACHDYTEFSNEAGNGTQSGCNSVESLHNDIHGIVGQSRGHMTYIMYSGFDPIFFLHHAMVDRIIAMWQVLNPDSYVFPTPAGSSAFTISRGEIVNGSTPLTPFHSDSFGGFWTAESARNISTFGYTYSELSSYSTTNVSDNVLKAIDTLYGGTAAAKNISRTGRRSVAETPEDDPPDTYIEWFAEIRVPKMAFERLPFCIHLFLGNVPRDIQMWKFKAAGSHCVSPRSPRATAPNCTNCNDEELDYSTIPLTNALVDKVYASELRNLDPKRVRRFLQDNFKYRVVATKVTQLGRSNLKSLGITIVGMLTTLPRNEYELPTWACVVARMDFNSGRESAWWEREYTEKGYIGCVEKMPSRVS